MLFADKSKNRTILTVAAHPDDEILGIGGSIRRLVDDGAVAYALILGEGAISRTDTRNETGAATVAELHSDSLSAASHVGYTDVFFANLPDNRFDSLPLLDVVKIVEKCIRQTNPSTIFTHHHGDLNIDHRVTCEAVATATRPVGKNIVPLVACFETLSSTEWAFPSGLEMFRPNIFVDIGARGLQAKCDAMECYHSELVEFPHPRSIKSIEAAAVKWGSVCGSAHAEALSLLRSIIA